jgi:hypothetical protein
MTVKREVEGQRNSLKKIFEICIIIRYKRERERERERESMAIIIDTFPSK